MYDQRLKDGKTFYCPNGHGRSFILGQTAEDKLRRERDQLKQRIAYKDDMIREAEQRAEHERRRANGYKGHATRITKRAKAGVCPCCNRTFKQLAQHMANKHPEFTPIALEDRPPEGATVQ
jgi:cell division septum initiation protein DivIVA